MCCSPWDCKELDTTEWLNWTEEGNVNFWIIQVLWFAGVGQTRNRLNSLFFCDHFMSLGRSLWALEFCFLPWIKMIRLDPPCPIDSLSPCMTNKLLKCGQIEISLHVKPTLSFRALVWKKSCKVSSVFYVDYVLKWYFAYPGWNKIY